MVPPPKPRPGGRKPFSEMSQAERDMEEIRRVRMPKGSETLGLLLARLGGSRCRVKCMDGNERICRIPGRLKRSLWVRENDIVLVEPWEFNGDEKGDIIFKYRPVQVKWLRNKGVLDELESDDEF